MEKRHKLHGLHLRNRIRTKTKSGALRNNRKVMSDQLMREHDDAVRYEGYRAGFHAALVLLESLNET